MTTISPPEVAVRAAARLRARYRYLVPTICDTAIDEMLWAWGMFRPKTAPRLPSEEWLVTCATEWLINCELVLPFRYPPIDGIEWQAPWT